MSNIRVFHVQSRPYPWFRSTPPVPVLTVRIDRIVPSAWGKKRSGTYELHIGRVLKVEHWIGRGAARAEQRSRTTKECPMPHIAVDLLLNVNLEEGSVSSGISLPLLAFRHRIKRASDAAWHALREGGCHPVVGNRSQSEFAEEPVPISR